MGQLFWPDMTREEDWSPRKLGEEIDEIRITSEHMKEKEKEESSHEQREN